MPIHSDLQPSKHSVGIYISDDDTKPYRILTFHAAEFWRQDPAFEEPEPENPVPYGLAGFLAYAYPLWFQKMRDMLINLPPERPVQTWGYIAFPEPNTPE